LQKSISEFGVCPPISLLFPAIALMRNSNWIEKEKL
jgi:hypothetical protein